MFVSFWLEFMVQLKIAKSLDEYSVNKTELCVLAPSPSWKLQLCSVALVKAGTRYESPLL